MLDRKLLRDLKSSRGLLLAIVSIMALGIALFVGMRSTFQSLAEAKAKYYQQSRIADFWIDLKKAPNADLERLMQVPGIRDFETRIQFATTVDLPGRDQPVNGLAISLPEVRETVINDILLVRGDYFSGARGTEILVNDKFAQANNVQPGDHIRLLLNERSEEFLVVGTAISAEFTYLLGPGTIVPDPENFGVFYLPRRHMEQWLDFEGAANQVVGHLAPRSGHRVERILSEAELRLRDYGVFSTTSLEDFASNFYLSNEIAQLNQIGTFLPTLFLGVAALILNVLMTRLTRSQRVVIGTLKAVGYEDWRIFLHYVKFGLVVGIVAAGIGSLLGWLLTVSMTNMYQEFFQFPDLRPGYHWPTHLTGLVVCMVFTLLGTVYGAWQMLRLRPAEAMRSEPPAKGGHVLLERFPLLWDLLSSRWRVTLRNIFRGKLRSGVTLFSALVGAGILTSGLMLQSTGEFFVREQFERLTRSDIDLTFKDALDITAWYELQTVAGIDQVEPTFSVACDLVHGRNRESASVMGILPESMLTVPTDRQGNRIRIPEVGLVMERRLAENLGAGVGDMVRLEPKIGDRRVVEVPIAALSQGYFGLNVYANLDYLSQIRGESLALTGAQLKVNPEPQSMRRMYGELKQMPAVESIHSRTDMLENMRSTIVDNQQAVIGMIVAFAGTIFFGNVLNASLVNLAERLREISTLAAMGYTPWEIGGLLLRETMLLNLVGTLLGFPLGYLLTYSMTLTMDQDLIRFPIIFEAWMIVAVLAASITFTLAAHAVVQRRIFKLDPLEGLKVRE